MLTGRPDGPVHPHIALDNLRTELNAFPDLERIATRIALRSVRPRELASLRDALARCRSCRLFYATSMPMPIALTSSTMN